MLINTNVHFYVEDFLCVIGNKPILFFVFINLLCSLDWNKESYMSGVMRGAGCREAMTSTSLVRFLPVAVSFSRLPSKSIFS